LADNVHNFSLDKLYNVFTNSRYILCVSSTSILFVLKQFFDSSNSFIASW